MITRPMSGDDLRERLVALVSTALICLGCASVPATAWAVDGDIIESYLDITPIGVPTGDRAGESLALVEDAGGVGLDALAVGRPTHDGPPGDSGAVDLLFLTAGGNVSSRLEISEAADPNNAVDLLFGDNFGHAVTSLGDFDGDGNIELAVGAPLTDSALGFSTGAVWILDLTPVTGVPISGVRIAHAESGFSAAALEQGDEFGSSVASLGDWDGDGIGDLAVGARRDDDGGTDHGAVYVLYLNGDGSVKSQHKISETVGGFGGVLESFGRFGAGLSLISDQNADGRPDLAVGAAPTSAEGAVWLLYTAPGCFSSTPTCSVESEFKIAEGTPGFSGTPGNSSRFGESVAWMPASSPLDTDRLVVGSPSATAFATGAVWLIDLTGGTVNGTHEISDLVGWDVDLVSLEALGSGVAALGDVNSDGISDFAMGASGMNSASGSVFSAVTSACPSLILRPVVYHNPNDEAQDPCGAVTLPDTPTVALNLYIESGDLASPLSACNAAEGGGTEMCAWDVRLIVENGFSIASFTPTAPGIDFSDPVFMPNELRINWIDAVAPQNGAVRIGTVVINNDQSGDGIVRIGPGSAAVGAALQLQSIGERTIALPEPGTGGLLAGLTLLSVIAVVDFRRRRRASHHGLTRDSCGPGSRSMALLLVRGFSVLAALTSLPVLSSTFLPLDAFAATSIKTQIRFSEGESMFPLNTSTTQTRLGTSLAAPGDIDSDGTPDLVFGCCSVVGLNPDEKLFVEFLGDNGGPVAPPVPVPGFGLDVYAYAMTAIPDRDGDGRMDLLLGTPTTSSFVPDQVSMLFLNRDGTRKETRLQFGDGLGGFPPGLLMNFDLDQFGASVAWLGDIDGDGITHEFVVGAPGDDTQFAGSGAIWILSIDATNTVTKQQKLLSTDLGVPASSSFGSVVGALGDLDGNGTNDLAVAAPGFSTTPGALVVSLLEPNGSGGVQSLSTTIIAEGQGGLPTPLGRSFRVKSIAWMGPVAGGEGGVLAVGADGAPGGEVYLMHLRADGTVRDYYRIHDGAGVGETLGTPWGDSGFGSSLAAPGDLDGDEVADLVVGARDAQAARGGSFSVTEGAVFVFQMIDSDFDGLDDNLDNCPGGPGIDPVLAFNPVQADADADGVGDLCDVCPFVADPAQADADADGTGDLCEPVVLHLQPTGTPSAPSWDVSIECGAYGVVEANLAIIPPAGGGSPALSLTCPAPPPGGLCGAVDLGNSTVTGTGLAVPAGVRSDAFYLHLEGDGAGGQICQALDPPSKIGELVTNPIVGTVVAAAALSEEGVQTPGLGLALAMDDMGPIPISEIELTTGAPLPRVTLELGPAVVDGGNTRWDVLLRNANDRFHRVAFGLVAPFGTTTADMRFAGCTGTTAEPGEVRTCGAGVGPTVNALRSWTVGPVAPAQTPAGLREHTLYVVTEGAIPFGISLPYLNLPGQTIVLGTIELTGAPDLEPSLILEGVDLIDDRFGAGALEPFERSVVGPLLDLNEVQLVGQFNPAEDVDGDGIQDLADNCPFSQNVDQADDGGFQSTDPDARGNACQCGDGSRDGVVDDSVTPSDDDLVQIRDFLLGRITNPIIRADVEARCSVAGSPECNIRDLVLLQQALDSATPSETRCDASLAPAP